jgi:hypothetical protein
MVNIGFHYRGIYLELLSPDNLFLPGFLNQGFIEFFYNPRATAFSEFNQSSSMGYLLG